MKQLFIHFLLAFLLPVFLMAQDFEPKLQVLNPQQNWNRDQGTIEEAVYTIEPKGTYAEIGMYLTFSARDSYFQGEELLEVVLNFNLPEGAHITDSWLWVEEEIMRAQILDLWTASGIYEEIVNRQRDPSLLTKKAPGQFELRVYPMPADSTRRVKITYLVPIDQSLYNSRIPVAFDIVEMSRSMPEVFYVQNLQPEAWEEFTVVEFPGLLVEDLRSEEGLFYERIDLNSTKGNARHISFFPPNPGGPLLNTFYDGEEGWYQLSVFPDAMEAMAEPEKVAIIVDFDENHTTHELEDILETTREILKSTFTEEDSLNFIYSNLQLARLRESWQPANKDSIDLWIDTIKEDSLATFSNLPILLAEAIDFVNNDEMGGMVLLLSSSNSMSDLELANRFLADLQAKWNDLPQIHIADFSNRSLQITRAGTEQFSGNSYFYSNLARLTAGSFEHSRDVGFTVMMDKSFSSLGPAIQTYDLYTTTQGGFTFSRFDLESVTSTHLATNGVSQIGRFVGDFPFEVELSGIIDEMPFSATYTIENTGTFEVDSTLKSLWTGYHIESLESRPQSNDIISEIINYSLDERVLSRYTAFLALEPGIRDQEACGEACRDESEGPISIPNTENPLPQVGVRLQSHPNPFTEYVQIEVELPVPVSHSEFSISVFDVLGRKLATLQPDSIQESRTFSITWDGTTGAGDYLGSGIYFLVVETPFGRHSLKLVLIR